MWKTIKWCLKDLLQLCNTMENIFATTKNIITTLNFLRNLNFVFWIVRRSRCASTSNKRSTKFNWHARGHGFILLKLQIPKLCKKYNTYDNKVPSKISTNQNESNIQLVEVNIINKAYRAETRTLASYYGVVAATIALLFFLFKS